MTHHSMRELRLATALVEAADTLTESFEATDHLRRVADHCVELLAARAAGIMLIDGGRAVSMSGSSRQEAVVLDLLAAQHGGGPCLESYGSGRPVPPVSIRAAHAEARWPDFTERALGHGIAGTFAVPLRRGGTALGALNVFLPAPPDGSSPDGSSPGGESGLPVAQLLADAAAVGVQNHRTFTQYRSLTEQLQEALSSRVRIEQAKGMLAERWNIEPDEAFATLRQYARRRRLPVNRVAQAVIERVADDELRREGPGGSGESS
ncbi:ANTAR domain-containing protein [Streptomyces sp. NPDC001401]|uniref:ANTAR domain-containing protein n=1 Tax=Streptomyces sp. NPDC001401 TaxID=3364570 RepID=UPI0036AC997E